MDLNPAKDIVDMMGTAFEGGYKVGAEHNQQADAHNLEVIQDNAQREQVLAKETEDFDMPDVGDFS